MKVFRSPFSQDLAKSWDSALALTIGNFDGCHRGHQELIRHAMDLAKRQHWQSACLSFDPNPKQYFRPDLPLNQLFSVEQKTRALSEMGLDILLLQSFDLEFSQLSAEQFFVGLMVKTLGAKALVVGYDFCFGKGREGNGETLLNLGKHYGVDVHILPALTENSESISSSLIRKNLASEQVREAGQYLGRPFLIEGQVEKGKQLGRTLGFPTANLRCPNPLFLAPGVYAGRAVLESSLPILNLPTATIPCIMNIGFRPTVETQANELKVEVHLLAGEYGPDQLYGRSMGIYLCDFIRKEQKFAGLEQLVLQIKKDVLQAKSLLS